MKKIIILLFLSFCFWSCKEKSIEPIDSQAIKAGESKTFEVNGGKLTISVYKIDDSRCPTDVECIWAGANIVTLTASTEKNTSGKIELCSNCESYNDFPASSLIFDNYKITLLDSKPYNLANSASTIKSAYFNIESL